MANKGRCILFVDDEPNILNALEREARDWAAERSLEILTAVSAPQGLKILDERGTDTVIVVSDLKMPEMKGSDFLLEVRGKFPDIVSILLTGFSETQETIKAVRAGIFSYMLKPWDSECLISELQKAYEYGDIRRQNARYLKMIEEELKWAGEMQKAILKPNLPRSDKIEFAVNYRPLKSLYCGGDYYDVIFLGNERYLLLLGDVAGHGVKAALVTGILKAIIYSEYVRALIGHRFSTSAFLAWLNDRMNFELRAASNVIITFFAGVIDLGKNTFRYSNAGHNHPFIVRAGRTIELPVSGSAIGFAENLTYTEQSIKLLARDTIVLYTDGLIELACEDGRPPIKLEKLLVKTEYGPDFRKRLLEAALAEAGTADFSDDVTILSARKL